MRSGYGKFLMSWAGASGQTVQWPTVALQSGFWRHWIDCLPKPHILTGPKIVVGLGVELYIETDNGDRIYFWNASTLVSTDACVGLRRFYSITTWITWNIRSGRFAKNNVLLVYIHKSLTEKSGLNYVPNKKVSCLAAINVVLLDGR